MNDLNIFFVMFAVHGEKEWAAHSGYMLAKKEEDIPYLLGIQHGEINLRYIEPVEAVEGKIFYGIRWISSK